MSAGISPEAVELAEELFTVEPSDADLQLVQAVVESEWLKAQLQAVAS